MGDAGLVGASWFGIFEMRPLNPQLDGVPNNGSEQRGPSKQRESLEVALLQVMVFISYLVQKLASPSPTVYDQLAMLLAVLCRLRSANLTSRVWRLPLR